MIIAKEKAAFNLASCAVAGVWIIERKTPTIDNNAPAGYKNKDIGTTRSNAGSNAGGNAGVNSIKIIGDVIAMTRRRIPK